MNVVADGVGRPKTIGAARFQEIFRCNAPEEFLCIIEKFTRLFTDFLVVENRRITTAQFPRMKKRRPIDVLDQIAHLDVPGSARRWRAYLGRWPRCFLRGIPYPGIIFTRRNKPRVPRISRYVIELFV